MTLTGSGMLLTLRHYIGFLSYAVDVLRYVALNVVNLRCLVVQCNSLVISVIEEFQLTLLHGDHDC